MINLYDGTKTRKSFSGIGNAQHRASQKHVLVGSGRRCRGREGGGDRNDDDNNQIEREREVHDRDARCNGGRRCQYRSAKTQCCERQKSKEGAEMEKKRARENRTRVHIFLNVGSTSVFTKKNRY